MKKRKGQCNVTVKDWWCSFSHAKQLEGCAVFCHHNALDEYELSLFKAGRLNIPETSACRRLPSGDIILGPGCRSLNHYRGVESGFSFWTGRHFFVGFFRAYCSVLKECTIHQQDSRILHYVVLRTKEIILGQESQSETNLKTVFKTKSSVIVGLCFKGPGA